MKKKNLQQNFICWLLPSRSLLPIRVEVKFYLKK